MTTNLETRDIFLPRDAQWANEYLEKAAILSRSDSFFEAHCGASFAALEGVLLSLATAPTYLIHGTYHFVANVLQLNLSGAVSILGYDLLASTQTLLFGALGVFYVALGILMPQTVFTVFEPIIHPPGENVDDVIEQRDTLRRELDAQRQTAEQETQGRELLQHQFNNLTNQFGEQNTTLDQVREQFRVSQENEQNSRGEIDELRERVQGYNQLQETHQELTNIHGQLTQERDGLNQNISDLTNILGQRQQELAGLEDLPQQRDQLQQEVRQATEANTTLNEQLATLREENGQLTATIEEVQQQFDGQKEALETVSEQYVVFTETIESNQLEIATLTEKLKAAEKIQEQYQALQEEVQNFEELNEELNQDLEKSLDDSLSKNQLEQAQEEIQELKNSLSSLEEIIGNKDLQIEKQSEKIGGLVQKNIKIKQEIAQNRIPEERTEPSNKDEIHQLKEVLRKHREDNKALQEQVTKLSQDQEDLIEKERSNQALKLQLQQARKEIENLKKQIQELKEELEQTF